MRILSEVAGLAEWLVLTMRGWVLVVPRKLMVSSMSLLPAMSQVMVFLLSFLSS